MGGIGKERREGVLRRGAGREDLYYRLAVLMIEVPPLRRHREDIPPLAGHFAKRVVQLGISPRAISPAAIKMLRAYDWPGNVRQLEHTIQHAALYTDSPEITPENVRDIVKTAPRSAPPPTLRDMEREYFLGLIRKHSGNLLAIARESATARQFLYKRFRHLGLWDELCTVRKRR